MGIPDETNFDEDPTDVCKDTPNPDTYKPKTFFNTALMQGKVNLTWDETDPKREAAMKRAFEISTNDDDENDDVKAYLAMSSSDEDEYVQSDKDDPKDIQIEDSSCFSSKEGEMEMTFATDEAKTALESQEYNDRLEQN